MPTDDELRILIETELLNDERLSSHTIRVSVRDGIVTLEGDVDSHRRRLAAHEIATHYEGVQEVVNRLTVSPPGPVSDEEVTAHVCSALDASADVTKATVNVAVVGGKVTLSGNVGSHWERMVAEDIARATRGVREVENLLMVDLETKIADEELANAIKAALSRARGLTDAEIFVSVQDSSAVLSGEVDQLWKKETAETVVRRFGLLHIQNQISVKPRSGS